MDLDRGRSRRGQNPDELTDIRNAGGHWQDEPVVASRERGWTLITSRKPADLDAFNTAFVEAFAE